MLSKVVSATEARGAGSVLTSTQGSTSSQCSVQAASVALLLLVLRSQPLVPPDDAKQRLHNSLIRAGTVKPGLSLSCNEGARKAAARGNQPGAASAGAFERPTRLSNMVSSSAIVFISHHHQLSSATDLLVICNQASQLSEATSQHQHSIAASDQML